MTTTRNGLLLSAFLLFSLAGAVSQTARVQVIHNAADTAAAAVDVYLNGTRLLNDFMFRTATPFIDAPAGTPINIGIAGKNSTSASDTLKNFRLTLTAGEKYVVIANGVLSPANYAPNPDGRSTAFTLLVKTAAKESGTGGNVEFAVVHGSTDAPGVDVVARGVGTLVNNALYRDITSYLAVPPASYILDVKDSTGTATVASFSANLSGLANRAAVVFASGFLTPGSNRNGAAFGLYAALDDGTVVPFGSIVSDVKRVEAQLPSSYELSQNYPNPFNPSTEITFALPVPQTTTLKVYNAIGQEVSSLVSGLLPAGEYRVSFDASRLSSGVYFYRLEAGQFTTTKRMMLLK